LEKDTETHRAGLNIKIDDERVLYLMRKLFGYEHLLEQLATNFGFTKRALIDRLKELYPTLDLEDWIIDLRNEQIRKMHHKEVLENTEVGVST